MTWFVHGLKAGQRQQLRAVTSDVSKGTAKVVVAHVPERYTAEVRIQQRVFTTYHYGAQWARPFLYPVLGPGDTPLTRAWPIRTDVAGEERDHPHHKSIWVAYGECGRVDNWSEEPGHGTQRHRRFIALQSGPVFGRVAAVIDWCYPGGRKQFREVRDMTFYALTGGGRLVDVQITFRMTEKTVTFRDTKEGGLLSVRVATPMDAAKGGRIENAFGGVNEAETWGKPAPWCDYSGEVDGRRVGIAVFDHEANPRFPTRWHVRDYGLMTANCFALSHYAPGARQRGDMTFPKGGRATWRYRVYVHAGDARKGDVGGRYMDYFAPPRVHVAA